jgi:hypothetical protein
MKNCNMRIDWSFTELEPGLRNVATWDASSPAGVVYRIQASWPLQWTSRESPSGKPVYAM